MVIIASWLIMIFLVCFLHDYCKGILLRLAKTEKGRHKWEGTGVVVYNDRRVT